MRALATDVSGVAADGPVVVAAAPRRPKLLYQLDEALRSRHYSPRTEQMFCLWAEPFIDVHHLLRPYNPGTLGPSRREDEDDLHSCRGSRPVRGPQSARWTLPFTGGCYVDPHKMPYHARQASVSEGIM
jgi:hypothetical protein